MLQVDEYRFNEFSHGRKELVGTGQILQMSPVALNGIQHGAIGRQKKWLEPFFDGGETGCGHSATMVRSVVQDNQHRFIGRYLFDNCIQEGNEDMAITSSVT